MNKKLIEMEKSDLINYVAMLKQSNEELLELKMPRQLISRLESIESAVLTIYNFMDNRLSLSFRDKKRVCGISNKKRQQIKERDNFTCQCCKANPSGFHEIKWHIDHIIPVSKGGSDEDSNLQLLCSKCNLIKRDYILQTFVKSKSKPNDALHKNNKSPEQSEGDVQPLQYVGDRDVVQSSSPSGDALHKVKKMEVKDGKN